MFSIVYRLIYPCTCCFMHARHITLDAALVVICCYFSLTNSLHTFSEIPLSSRYTSAHAASLPALLDLCITSR